MNRTLAATMLAALVSLVSTPSDAAAQPAASSRQTPRDSSSKNQGSITGRVSTEGGDPIPNASVDINGVGVSGARIRSAGTDEDGQFRVDELSPGTYRILLNAPAYYFESDAANPRFYKPGDWVSLKMAKGGVITGTVTSASGEPVIAVSVSAIRVRELDGKPPRQPQSSAPRRTDDRGIYRIFGLKPGVYLVMAGRGETWEPATAYSDDGPTYYPSATRDGAAEVTVNAHQELNSIDIRYRAEKGHVISGTVAVAAEGNASTVFGSSVALTDAAGTLTVAQSNVDMSSKERAFEFRGVADGDYLLRANRHIGSEPGIAAASPRAVVKVKGSDVTGIELKLIPLSSISGQLEKEPAKEQDAKPKCASKRGKLIEETALLLRRDEKAAADDPLSQQPAPLLTAPGDKGDFQVNSIEAGLYRIETRLPGDEWYLRSITLPSPSGGKPPLDAARNGILIRSGQNVQGLTITIKEGAAGLRARVTSSTKDGSLPARLRVHMVPAEKESADELLRYFETGVESDGSFTISNIAPGKYWLLAEPPSEKETSSQSGPLAWEPSNRLRLRLRGEKENISIELDHCQRLVDYVLKYSLPPAPARKPNE